MQGHILFKREVIRLIKCIVSDLDGTLLQQDFSMSSRTINALKNMLAQGVTFLPATGRSYSDIVELFHRNDIPCKSILLNGAQARDEEGRVLKQFAIAHKLCDQVLQILQRHNCSIQLFCSDALYAYQDAQRVAEDISAVITRNIQKPYHADVMMELQEADKTLQTILKIETMSLDEERLNACCHELRDVSDILCMSSIRGNLEIVDHQSSKGSMLMKLIEDLPFNKEELLIFGDNLNDLSLFDHFPNTIAVANAHPEIKRKAKQICLSSDQDGVAIVLEALGCR